MTDADILRLWQSRYDTWEIANQFGVPEYEVANRLMGIRMRAKAAEMPVFVTGHPPTTSTEDYP